MTEARGRFQITVLDKIVYAIGGSNGMFCDFEKKDVFRKLFEMLLLLLLQVQLSWTQLNVGIQKRKNGANVAAYH